MGSSTHNPTCWTKCTPWASCLRNDQSRWVLKPFHYGMEPREPYDTWYWSIFLTTIWLHQKTSCCPHNFTNERRYVRQLSSPYTSDITKKNPQGNFLDCLSTLPWQLSRINLLLPIIPRWLRSMGLRKRETYGCLPVWLTGRENTQGDR